MPTNILTFVLAATGLLRLAQVLKLVRTGNPIDSSKPMAYLYLMRTAPMTVIETPSFLRDAKRLMDDEEREEIVAFLAQNPNAGDLLQGTGGIRKVRFARDGGGRSGGYRVVYFFHSQDIPLFALNIFAKNEKANISPADRNALKELAAKLAEEYRTR